MSPERKPASEGALARWQEVSRVVSPDAVAIGAVALVVLTGLNILNAIAISGSSGLLILAGYLYRLRATHGKSSILKAGSAPPLLRDRVVPYTTDHEEDEANPPPP